MADKQPRFKLHLSDQAWHYLKESAYTYGYTHPEYERRGINYYVEALSYLTYYDARPEFMRPTYQWYQGDVTIPRTLIISPECVLRFAHIAYTHKIPTIRSQQPILNGARMTAHPKFLVQPDHLYVSAVLEAIGIRWLRPTAPVPMAPASLWDRAQPRRRRYEKSRKTRVNLPF